MSIATSNYIINGISQGNLDVTVNTSSFEPTEKDADTFESFQDRLQQDIERLDKRIADCQESNP